MNSRRADRHAGFTVIELLMALLLLSLLSMLSYRGLTAVLATRAQVSAETHKWQRVSAFLQRFQRDIELAAPRPVRLATGTRPAWQGQPDNQSGPLLIFSRFARRDDTDRPRRLAYTLSTQQVIELWLWPGLDLADDEGAVRYPLLRGIRRLDLHYLDAQQIWQDRWPVTADRQRLPQAVRLRIVLDTGEAVERVFGVGI